jgi:hypothetical protein
MIELAKIQAAPCKSTSPTPELIEGAAGPSGGCFAVPDSPE